MKKKNANPADKHKKNYSTTKMTTRILAIILALLMVASVVFIAVSSLY